MTTPIDTSRKRMSSALRKQSILNSTIPLFAQKGFHGTSTKELAAAAGISEALLFRHFRSKEALYQEIQQILLAPPNPVVMERLLLLPRAVFSLMLIQYHLLHMLFAESPGIDFERVHAHKMRLTFLLEDPNTAKTYQQQHLEPLIPCIAEQMHFLTNIGELKKTPLQPSEILSYCHQLAVGHLLASLQESTLIASDISPKKQNRNVMRFMLLGCGFTRKQIQSLNWSDLGKAYKKLMN